jgi:hypothetical protein
VIVFVCGEPAPSHSSVAADSVGLLPPNPNAAACVPAPANLCLQMVNTCTVVQDVPLYSSVVADKDDGVAAPAKATTESLFAAAIL